MPASFGGIAGMNPLVIPTAPAVALPSVRVDDTNATYKREIYGGKGDKPHLGGFTELDPDGMSPALWKWMIEYVGVKSLLDVSSWNKMWCDGFNCSTDSTVRVSFLSGGMWSWNVHNVVSNAWCECFLCRGEP